MHYLVYTYAQSTCWTLSITASVKDWEIELLGFHIRISWSFTINSYKTDFSTNKIHTWFRQIIYRCYICSDVFTRQHDSSLKIDIDLIFLHPESLLFFNQTAITFKIRSRPRFFEVADRRVSITTRIFCALNKVRKNYFLGMLGGFWVVFLFFCHWWVNIKF